MKGQKKKRMQKGSINNFLNILWFQIPNIPFSNPRFFFLTKMQLRLGSSFGCINYISPDI